MFEIHCGENGFCTVWLTAEDGKNILIGHYETKEEAVKHIEFIQANTPNADIVEV